MCLHQNLERRKRELEASKVVSSRNRSHVNRYRLVLMQCWNQLFYRWPSADNVNGQHTDGVGEKYVGLYKKENIRVQVISMLGMFSFVPRIVMSRISVGFIFRLWV